MKLLMFVLPIELEYLRFKVFGCEMELVVTGQLLGLPGLQRSRRVDRKTRFAPAFRDPPSLESELSHQLLCVSSWPRLS